VFLIAKELKKATSALKETITADDEKVKSPKKGGCLECGGDHSRRTVLS